MAIISPAGFLGLFAFQMAELHGEKKWGVILTTYNTSGRFPSPFLAKAAANASKSVLLVETNL